MATRFSLRLPALLIGPVVALAFASGCSPQESPDAPVTPVETGSRPNIVVVVVDDLRWDEVGYVGHPYLETPNIDRLAREGVAFSQAVHAVPLCSPNRASILTGQYPSRHGIIDNVARNRMSHNLETFPQALQEVGYETAFLGKWHMGNDPTPRPGFDYWVAIPGQGRVNDPELYEDGRLDVAEGYITDVLTDRAVSFIEQDRDQPFLMYIGHKAVHPDTVQRDDGSVDPTELRAYVPAPRHRGRYEETVFPRRPNVVASPDELVGKPALRRALAVKHSDEMEDMFGPALDHGTSEETIRRRAEMMLAVDEGLGRIMDALAAQGALDDTLIVFTSDNGFFYGEQGLSSVERRMPYEEGVRMPLVIRYPALAGAGLEVDDLVLSIDIAPTALEAAGEPVGDHIQGRSLVPLLQGTATDWRESALIEFYTYENPWPWLVDMDYRAIRTAQFKYIHWMHYPDEGELYDLVADPYEMTNVIDDPAFALVADDLRARLAEAVLEAMNLDRR